MITPEHITALEPHEIIVVGTNIVGNHAGGAARQAADDFELEDGIGEGLCGQTYAFPTLNERMEQYDYGTLCSIREAFYRCAKAHTGMRFLLTKVGCGIAGYPEEMMRSLFTNVPENVIKPEGW